jgi:hypothetical protein
MSQSADAVRNGLVLRLSVPASGELRAVATALAVKVAEQLGVKNDGSAPVARAIDDLARRVAASEGNGGQTSTPADIAFEIYKLDRELKIEARSNGRASEARIPLPA